MPIPRPMEQENRKDYVSRCVAFLSSEGRKPDEARAIAESKWDSVDREHTLSAEVMDRYLLEAMPRRSNQFRKDAIREGDFINSNTGQPLAITRERLEGWADNFRKMMENGVNVPIADGHDTSKPLGSISGMAVVEDDDGKARLVCDYEFADEDAVVIAKRAKYVSIATDPDYMDCEGNHYGEVIQHVAVTATPVITRQHEYVQLSRAVQPANENETEVEMGLISEMASVLGIETAEMDDEAVKTAVMDEIKKMRTPEEPETDETVPEGAEAVAEPETEPETEPENAVEPEIEKVAAPAAVQAVPVAASLSRELAEALAESAEARIERLVANGMVTPAVGRELRLSFIGRDIDSVNVLTLSKGSAERSIVNQVIDILEKNDPVELGRRTEKQIVVKGERIVRSEELSEADRFERERLEIEAKMKEKLSK